MIVRPPQPPPPEPEPDSLDQQVDWMTYSHHELYRMVHDGLDLAGAIAVSANWARLGDSLGEIGDELNQIVQAFEHVWQGEAADQAVHAVSSLATWATEAGGLATEVSGCITIEVDNATRARNGMPAPLVGPSLPPHLPPHPGPIPAAGGTLAASAFTGGDFAMAPLLITDQTAIARERNAAHRQAAETMEQFQTESREVYRTVPGFSAPKIGPKPPGGEENPPAPQPTPPQQAPSEPSPSRSPAVAEPVAGRSSPVASPGPVATPGPVAAPGPVSTPAQPGPGPAPGQPGAEPARPAAAASAAAAEVNRPGGSSMGGMPMGGMGGGRKAEDLERKSPAYVKEDEDLWGLGDQVVAPPVIGEDQGRRA
jgi:hypothetical protein